MSIHGLGQPDILEASEIRKESSRAQIHPLDDNLPSTDTPAADASKSGRVHRGGRARKWAGGVFWGVKHSKIGNGDDCTTPWTHTQRADKLKRVHFMAWRSYLTKDIKKEKHQIN